MTDGTDMAAIAALVGDPARANILATLMDGRAHTATELAKRAGIAPPTASGHLARLTHGRLVSVAAQGRHRYYRLLSDEIARMLEGIMVVASRPTPTAERKRRATPKVDPAMRGARTCYDHIAGEIGVAIADALIARGAVRVSSDEALITDDGHVLLGEMGISLSSTTRRPQCRPCLDWTERRPHLAGMLGAALLDQALASGWLSRIDGSRALRIDDARGEALAALLIAP